MWKCQLKALFAAAMEFPLSSVMSSVSCEFNKKTICFEWREKGLSQHFTSSWALFMFMCSQTHFIFCSNPKDRKNRILFSHDVTIAGAPKYAKIKLANYISFHFLFRISTAHEPRKHESNDFTKMQTFIDVDGPEWWSTSKQQMKREKNETKMHSPKTNDSHTPANKK